MKGESPLSMAQSHLSLAGLLHTVATAPTQRGQKLLQTSFRSRLSLVPFSSALKVAVVNYIFLILHEGLSSNFMILKYV